MIRDGMLYTDMFDGTCYLARYPDVAADGKYNTPEKALDHWVTYGEAEGRIPGCLIGPAPANQPPAPIDNSGATTAPTTQAGSSGSGLLIAGVALLIVFGDKIKKMFK